MVDLLLIMFSFHLLLSEMQEKNLPWGGISEVHQDEVPEACAYLVDSCVCSLGRLRYYVCIALDPVAGWLHCIDQLIAKHHKRHCICLNCWAYNCIALVLAKRFCASSCFRASSGSRSRLTLYFQWLLSVLVPRRRLKLPQRHLLPHLQAGEINTRNQTFPIRSGSRLWEIKVTSIHTITI